MISILTRRMGEAHHRGPSLVSLSPLVGSTPLNGLNVLHRWLFCVPVFCVTNKTIKDHHTAQNFQFFYDIAKNSNRYYNYVRATKLQLTKLTNSTQQHIQTYSKNYQL